MGDEIAAALGLAGAHDEFTDRVIERAQQRDLLCLSLGPGRASLSLSSRKRPASGV
jgi:hypothetical protein